MACSVVTFYIEHGEDTDPVTKMIDDTFFVPGLQVQNYELSIDVTEAQAETALSTTRDLHAAQFAANAV